MSISIKKNDFLNYKIELKVFRNDIKYKMKEKIDKISSSIYIKGFRKGLVPNIIIKNRYEVSIYKEVVFDLLELKFLEFVKLKNMKLAGKPLVENIYDDYFSDLIFLLNFEILPNIDLIDFKNIEFIKFNFDVSDKNINSIVDQFRDYFAKWDNVDFISSSKDLVIFDFLWSLNNEIEVNLVEDFILNLGENCFFDDFGDKLCNLKVGDRKKFSIKISNLYKIKFLRGKIINVDIFIKKVFIKKLEFIDNIVFNNFNFLNLEKKSIREKIFNALKLYINNTYKSKFRLNVLDIFLDKHIFSIPVILVNKEKDILLKEFNGNEDIFFNNETLEFEARKRISMNLLLNTVISKFNLKVEKGLLNEKLSSMFESNFIGKLKQNKESFILINKIENMILIEYCIDFIIDKSIIIDKSASLDVFFNDFREIFLGILY